MAAAFNKYVLARMRKNKEYVLISPDISDSKVR